MTTLYIARHGQTEWNLAGRIQGQQNSPLTDEGRDQARMLRDRLKGVHFDAIFTSDLSRAKETAEIIAQDRSNELKSSPHLRERSQGSLEGYHRDKARQDFSEMYELWDNSDDHGKMQVKTVPDAETLQEAADRFTQQVNQIIHDHPDNTILIVTHGMVMRAFLFNVDLAPFSQVEHIDNTGYLIIEGDGQKFELIHTSGVKGLSEQGLDKFPKKG